MNNKMFEVITSIVFTSITTILKFNMHIIFRVKSISKP